MPSTRITITIPQDLTTTLDRRRGPLTRTAYTQRLLRTHLTPATTPATATTRTGKRPDAYAPRPKTPPKR